jgi:large subunit ribosomal protein L21
MFAIIEDGAHQYKVSVGDTLCVQKKEVKEGDNLDFKQVLLLEKDSGEILVGKPFVEGVKVQTKVLEHGKDDKIRVFKKKSKKRFAKTQGHRQEYTKIEVTSIQ